MTAAITAAQNGHSVTLLEHKDRVGKKILVTGNGRCNLTNELLKQNPSEYYPLCDKEFIDSIFARFGYESTVKFFESLGIVLKKRGTLVYPYSDQASSVLDALRFKIRDLKIDVILNCEVQNITRISGDKFEVRTDESKLECNKVILCPGSKASSKTGSDGSGYALVEMLEHHINPVSPGLVQIRCCEDFYKEIAGIRIGAVLSLYDTGHSGCIYKEYGELQITNYGISGIVAMNLSNRLPLCTKNPYILIDFMSEFSREDLRSILKNKISEYPQRECYELLTGILPKKLAELILKLSSVNMRSLFSSLTESELDRLIEMIKEFKVCVSGTNTFEDAQICMGGIDISQVKDTMESKLASGLYFAGEILDLHGDCGGFNLQLAWTTGAIAGMLL